MEWILIIMLNISGENLVNSAYFSSLEACLEAKSELIEISSDIDAKCVRSK